jgi:hypothetical protein
MTFRHLTLSTLRGAAWHSVGLRVQPIAAAEGTTVEDLATKALERIVRETKASACRSLEAFQERR